MQYFLADRVEQGDLSTTSIQINRWKTFKNLQIQSKIVTFDFMTDEMSRWNAQQFPVQQTLNMFRWWQNATQYVQANESTVVRYEATASGSEKVSIQYYSNQYEQQKKRIKRVEIRNENAELLAVELWDIRGFLSEKKTYNNGIWQRNVWYTPNREEILIETNSDIRFTEYNPQYNPDEPSKNIFTNWVSIKTAWLDYLVVQDSSATLYLDNPITTLNFVDGMAEDANLFIVLNHESDYRLPFSDKQLRKVNGIIKHLDNEIIWDFEHTKMLLWQIPNESVVQEGNESGILYKQNREDAVIAMWRTFFNQAFSERVFGKKILVNQAYDRNNALLSSNQSLQYFAEQVDYDVLSFPTMSEIEQWSNQICENDHVTVAYPTFFESVGTNFKYDFNLLAAIKQKAAKLTIIVWDIQTYRENLVVETERNLLRLADLIVVPNKRMKAAIQHLGVKNEFLEMGLNPIHIERITQVPLVIEPYKILYTGNLNKAPFLIDDGWHKGFELFVYGPDASFKIDKTMFNRYDNLAFEQLVTQISGFTGFGLVWDGNSDPYDSSYGRYTQFNYPNKAALYLKLGIPIIAWSGSALGELVEEKQIGIVIDHLGELGECIRLISNIELSQIKNNVLRYREMFLSDEYQKLMFKNIDEFIDAMI